MAGACNHHSVLCWLRQGLQALPTEGRARAISAARLDRIPPPPAQQAAQSKPLLPLAFVEDPLDPRGIPFESWRDPTLDGLDLMGGLRQGVPDPSQQHLVGGGFEQQLGERFEGGRGRGGREAGGRWCGASGAEGSGHRRP